MHVCGGQRIPCENKGTQSSVLSELLLPAEPSCQAYQYAWVMCSIKKAGTCTFTDTCLFVDCMLFCQLLLSAPAILTSVTLSSQKNYGLGVKYPQQGLCVKGLFPNGVF